MTQKKFDTKCSGVENIIQTKHDMKMDKWLNNSNAESLLSVCVDTEISLSTVKYYKHKL